MPVSLKPEITGAFNVLRSYSILSGMPVLASPSANPSGVVVTALGLITVVILNCVHKHAILILADNQVELQNEN
jgi:hypothetical protein